MKKTAEQIAIEFAIAFEKSRGRNPVNVSKTRCGYDIRSSNRKIEIKAATPSNPPFVLFNQYNFAALQRENNFYLYVVYDLKNDPKLLIFNKNEILRRARFTFSWEIPIRKADLKK